MAACINHSDKIQACQEHFSIPIFIYQNKYEYLLSEETLDESFHQ